MEITRSRGFGTRTDRAAELAQFYEQVLRFKLVRTEQGYGSSSFQVAETSRSTRQFMKTAYEVPEFGHRL